MRIRNIILIAIGFGDSLDVPSRGVGYAVSIGMLLE